MRKLEVGEKEAIKLAKAKYNLSVLNKKSHHKNRMTAMDVIASSRVPNMNLKVTIARI